MNTRKQTSTARGLGWRHQQAVERLKRCYRDGTPCDWCGRPMYFDRTRNWDYNPFTPLSGTLQGDHADMSRKEAIRRGLPIPPPTRLLHGTCNSQRGDGSNDHLAANNTTRNTIRTDKLVMPWPW